jgi:hypothetical protein
MVAVLKDLPAAMAKGWDFNQPSLWGDEWKPGLCLGDTYRRGQRQHRELDEVTARSGPREPQ